ncbi:MAG: hypothetical protein FD138_4524 [Planctomycetota bacterium]|nr:MAG: hypothetical protein FD138_4524 [Planctomycetota bacterium]
MRKSEVGSGKRERTMEFRRRKLARTSDFRHPTSDFASGFTLLELILALGLASLLLAALYTALQMHWSSSALGHVEMERSGSTSSGSTSTDSSTGASSSTGSGGSTSSGSSGTSGSTTNETSSGSTGSSSSTTTTTENYSTQKTGLFGDEQSLIVHVSLPSRASSLGAAAVSTNTAATDETAGYVGSDMQSIAYFMAGSGSTLAQQLSGSLSSPLGQSTGLARLQGDRMAMQAADESGDLTSMAADVKLLAPEVASISFEYFDGVSWTTSWDSGTSNSIPNAIRITIDFLPPVATGGWYARPVSHSTDRFQHTVALPLAQPYVYATVAG